MQQPAHHTSQQRGTMRDDWGTPEWVLDIVRGIYGPITHDLASNDEANQLVGAKWYWTRENPCPLHPPTEPEDVVWCNPPGPCAMVEHFWRIWWRCVGLGGGFLVFNLDHLRQLPAPPQTATVLILRKRLRFVGASQGASFPSALVSPGRVEQKASLLEHGHLLGWDT